MNKQIDESQKARIIINREWCMPNHNTCEMKPIKELVKKYLNNSSRSVDPFARNCRLANITNDLDEKFNCDYSLKANVFLEKFTNYDLVLFDPPYSLRQVKECYGSVGYGFTHKDSQNAIRWTIERDIIAKKQITGDKVISFGWTSTCMGRKRGYKILEILLCSHGSAHNDTIVVVEEKIKAQIGESDE